VNIELGPVARRRLAWLGIAAAAFGLARLDSAPLDRFTTRVAQTRLQHAWHPVPSSPADAAARCAARPCAVARLIVPAQRTERIVLSQAAHRASAAGWGHLIGTPLPGAEGNTVFHAYQREDARLLLALAPGDALVVELPDARQFVYRVDAIDTADRRHVRVVYDTRAAQLTLIARHPDDPGLRCVVRASWVSAPLVAQAGTPPVAAYGA
jgi:sortase A